MLIASLHIYCVLYVAPVDHLGGSVARLTQLLLHAYVRIHVQSLHGHVRPEMPLLVLIPNHCRAFVVEVAETQVSVPRHYKYNHY